MMECGAHIAKMQFNLSVKILRIEIAHMQCFAPKVSNNAVVCSVVVLFKSEIHTRR